MEFYSALILPLVNHGMMQRINFVIDYAVLSDAKAVHLIEKECFSTPWSENQIIDEIVKENAIFITAKENGNLCGYISGQLILDEFYINNIAVSEKYRNNGIASSLIARLIEILNSKICVLATLEVRESNYKARKLYERFHFTNLGIRKDFYSDPKENACIYTLYFNESECNN